MKVQKPIMIVASLLLLLIGSTLFLLSFFSTTRTDTVIDTSFVLEPGKKQEAYHHTRIFTRSALNGEVSVEGEGINFTAFGYNTQQQANVYVAQNYSLVINPADDLYMFTFDNTKNKSQSSIQFTLEESWLVIPMLILSFIGLLILAPTGLILIIIGFLK